MFLCHIECISLIDYYSLRGCSSSLHGSEDKKETIWLLEHKELKTTITLEENKEMRSMLRLIILRNRFNVLEMFVVRQNVHNV